jgi:hypothetical protein
MSKKFEFSSFYAREFLIRKVRMFGPLPLSSHLNDNGFMSIVFNSIRWWSMFYDWVHWKKACFYIHFIIAFSSRLCANPVIWMLVADNWLYDANQMRFKSLGLPPPQSLFNCCRIVCPFSSPQRFNFIVCKSTYIEWQLNWIVCLSNWKFLVFASFLRNAVTFNLVESN